MPRLIALYNAPEDTDAFDAHYRDVHMAIVGRDEHAHPRAGEVAQVPGAFGAGLRAERLVEFAERVEGHLRHEVVRRGAAADARQL